MKEYRSSVKPFNYIIYHRGCPDGFSGFFVAYISEILKNAIFYPDVPSANKVPPEIDGKEILIIDVAYSKQILEIIFKYAKRVVFIDHHVSIRDDVQELYKKYNNSDNIRIIYDENRSGSVLAWKYLHPDRKIPLFLKYIEDQDTGKWLYSKTKPFVYGLRTYFQLNMETSEMKKWEKILDIKTVTKLIKHGKIMEKYNEHLVLSNLGRYSMEAFPSKKIYDLAPLIFSKIGQYRIALYNGLNCPSVTDLANKALEELDIDFCIMWVLNNDKKEYVLSMRSKEVDVSVICKELFNGGGHKLAAACSFSSKKYHISELFLDDSLPRRMKQK